MPTFGHEDIRARIAAGEVGAVSLDTSVFDQFGCNLGYKSLRKLDQFKDTEVAVIFSEVIAEEVKAHLAKAAEESAAEVKRAIVKYVKRWRLDLDRAAKEADLGLNENPEGFAEHQFAAFVQSVGADIVPVEGAVSLPDVLARYFRAMAPFSRKEGKKSEFPDAIALLSLENWAKEKDTLVMVVSRDHDWSKYAADSTRLFCLDELDRGLDYFNQEARFVATRVVAKLRGGAARELQESIDSALEAFLDDLDFGVDGASAYDYEYQPESAAVQYWHVAEDVTPLIVASDDDSVTFSIEIEALVGFHVYFDFFISVDEDHVPIGSTSQYVERLINFTVVSTVLREIDPEPEVLDVDATRPRIHVDFDSIDPQWDHEE